MKKIISIVAIVFFIALIRYFYLNNPEQSQSVYAICVSKKMTGYDCPGCGGQRAFYHLLHGNFIKAAKFNLFIYLFAPLLGYLFFMIVLRPFGVSLPDIDISTSWLVVVLSLLGVYTIVRNCY